MVVPYVPQWWLLFLLLLLLLLLLSTQGLFLLGSTELVTEVNQDATRSKERTFVDKYFQNRASSLY